MDKKRKILVIEDEFDFMELISKRLKANQYEVVTAGNGEDGLKLLEKEPCDAVLLDIMMPGADGIDVLRRIRKSHKYLPVFMVTAFSNEERFKLANSYNASGYIIKTDNMQDHMADIASAIEIAEKYKK